MAAREASVKLTLNNSQFLVTIKDTGDQVDKLGKRGKKSMDLLGAGLGGAKRALGELGGSVKSTLGMLATFGGTLSVGAGIQGALKLRSQFTQLAFKIQTATGETTTFADVQRIAERAAANTGRTTQEMTTAFGELVQATGDAKFAEGALSAIGSTAMATGEELGSIAAVADQLHTKFGVSAEGMQDALAKVWDASTKGGPSFAEFANVMGTAGAEMLAAGLKGQRGLDFMLGSLVNTDDGAAGLSKQVSGLRALLRGLGNQGELKKLAAQIGIDPKKLVNEKDAIARLRRIFSAGKRGTDALLGSMREGEEKETLKTLFVNPFQEALARAQASGLKGKAAIDAALGAFDQQIGQFGKATLSGAALVEQANRARQTPEARLNEALNRLQDKFGDPKIINALGKLSDSLPAFAELMGNLVSFAAESPMLAASAVLAGKALTGFAGDFAGAAVKGLAGRLAGGAAASAAGAAGSAAAGAAGAAGAGAAGAAAGAAGGGLLAAAGTALPIVAAIAAGGVLIGEQIKNAYENEADVLKELSEATAAAASGGSLSTLQKNLERLEAAKSRFREADVGGGAMDWIAGGITGVDSKAQANEQLAFAEFQTAELQRKIKAREQKAALAAGAVPVTPAEAAAAPPVKLADNAGKMIGTAVATELGGRVLTVRIANAGEIGLGRSNAGPGGSRGPMAAGRTAPGGGV